MKTTTGTRNRTARYGATAEERAQARREPVVRTQTFSQPPREIIGDRMTLPIDRVIVQLLADLDNGSYCCWPTNRQIAAEVGCSVRTVHSSLKRLNQLGWITIEPCPTVARGQVIRLNWRRPAPHDTRRGGRQSTAGGSAMYGGGVGNPLPTELDPVPRPIIRARAQGEEDKETSDALSPEELARWEGVAAGGDRVQARLARLILARHAAAAAAQGSAPGRSSLAENPGALARSCPTNAQ